MNKSEFVTRYTSIVAMLGEPATKVVVAGGGALLMLGIRKETSDLDLDVRKEVLNRYKTRSNVEVFDGREIVNLDKVVALHLLSEETETTIVEGVTVYSVDELIRFKQKLIASPERKKDKLAQDKADLDALFKLKKNGSKPAAFKW